MVHGTIREEGFPKPPTKQSRMSEKPKLSFWNRFTVKQIVLATIFLVAIFIASTCTVYTVTRTDGNVTSHGAQKSTYANPPAASNSDGSNIGASNTNDQSQSYASDPLLYQKFNPDVTPKFVGLLNPAISCYMNSSIQLMYHNPVYRKLLKKLVMEPPSEYIGEEAHKRMQALASFFHQMDISEPSAVLKANSHVLLPNNMTEENGQQDAQETLQEIFYGVLDDAITLKVSETGYYIYPTGVKKERNPINEERNIIQVEIPGSEKKVLTKKWTLNKLLQKSFETEIVTDAGEYDISKTYSLTHLPETLIIQIKRFGYDFKTKQAWKICDPIPTPDEFEMTQADGKVFKYRLNAFIRHGGGVGGGHYVAYVRNKDSQFICLNDASVSVMTQNELDSARDNAYIYSYLRVDK